MNDPATLSDIPPLSLSVDAHAGADDLELARRVERLESEVAALKSDARRDNAALEEHIVERVTERIQMKARSEQITATPPMASAAREPYADQAPISVHARGYGWLIVDMYHDARLIVLMLRDRRYALAWTTHLVVWVFLLAIFTSGWWLFPFAYLPWIGQYIDKLVDLLLAFGVYKALSREARRYREVIGNRS